MTSWVRAEGPGAGELGEGHPAFGEPPTQAGATLGAAEVVEYRFCLLTHREQVGFDGHCQAQSFVCCGFMLLGCFKCQQEFNTCPSFFSVTAIKSYDILTKY